jgi:hypothetical protein
VIVCLPGTFLPRRENMFDWVFSKEELGFFVEILQRVDEAVNYLFLGKFNNVLSITHSAKSKIILSGVEKKLLKCLAITPRFS